MKFHACLAIKHILEKRDVVSTPEKKNIKKKKRTKSEKEKAEHVNMKSAIKDHCKRENHVVDWGNIKVIRTENNKHQRWVMEVIETRQRGEKTTDRSCRGPGCVLRGQADSRGRDRPISSDRTKTEIKSLILLLVW